MFKILEKINNDKVFNEIIYNIKIYLISNI